MKRVDPEGVEKRRLKKGKVRAHLDIYEAFEVVQMDGHFKLPLLGVACGRCNRCRHPDAYTDQSGG